jgi:hypothetical protein
MKLEATALAESSLEAQKFSIRQIYEDLLRGDMKDRAPLFIAILSVAFQQQSFWRSPENAETFFQGYYLVLFGLVVFSAVFSIFASTSRLAIALFIAIAVIDFAPRWTSLANHTFLALWTIPFAVLFKEWWRSELYSRYLRITIGIVMFAAVAQKLIAGTYIDGSYIYWMSKTGSLTERMFSLACDTTAALPCIFIKFVSNFILLWQFTVGVLLIWGVRSKVFLTIEIGFLLGAGLFADEMNFQVLNIALLCLVFRVGMPMWLLVTCITLLFVDVYSIEYLLKTLVQHVA